MKYRKFQSRTDADSFCDVARAQGFCCYVVTYNSADHEARYWDVSQCASKGREVQS